MNIVQVNAVIEAHVELQHAISACLITLEFVPSVTLSVALDSENKLSIYVDSPFSKQGHRGGYVLSVDNDLTRMMLHGESFEYDPLVDPLASPVRINEILGVVMANAVMGKFPTISGRSGNHLNSGNYHSGKEVYITHRPDGQQTIQMDSIELRRR